MPVSPSKITSASPSPADDVTATAAQKVKARAKARRRATWLAKAKARAKHTEPQTGVKISETTKQRLLADAGLDARFAGMTPDEVSAYLLPRIETYRQSLPFWAGHFDKPKRAVTPSTTPTGMPEGLRRWRDEQNHEKAERDAKLRNRIDALATEGA